MYVNIPRASRQRALIINKLGTRHDVPQGGVEAGGERAEPGWWQSREANREREEEEKGSKGGR